MGTGMATPIRSQGQERPCISSRELSAPTKGGQRKITMKKLIFAALVVIAVTVSPAAPANLTGADTAQVGLDMLASSLAAAREALAATMEAGDVIDGVAPQVRDAVYREVLTSQGASLTLWEAKDPSNIEGGRVFVAWSRAVKAAVQAVNASLKCRRYEAATHYALVAAHAATAGYRAAAFVGHPAVFKAGELANAMTAFAKAVARRDLDAATAALTSFRP